MMSFRKRADGQAGDGPAGEDRAVGTVEIAAAALALLWLVAVAGLVFRGGLAGEGGGTFAALAGVMAVVMPVAVIGMVVATARQIRVLRAEADTLRAELLRLQAGGPLRPGADEGLPDGPRGFDMDADDLDADDWNADDRDADDRDSDDMAGDSHVPGPPAPPRMAASPPPAIPRDAGTAEDRGAPRGRPADAAPPPPPPAPAPEDDPVGDLSIDSYIVALNFPDSADDAEGIRALREALADEPTAKLIRAAQDVLTLLADDGVFMDDLPVDPAPASAWRRLARDGRGAALGPMGALVSPPVFERVAARMADDQVFHDAAHHFLRQFDRSLAALAEVGGDADLAALGDTRTARAFLLLGRVANSMG